MAGRVEADARYYKLPYDVLIGRDSDVIEDYRLTKLPHIFIIGKDGTIRFSQKFATYDELKEELDRIVR